MLIYPTQQELKRPVSEWKKSPERCPSRRLLPSLHFWPKLRQGKICPEQVLLPDFSRSAAPFLLYLLSLPLKGDRPACLPLLEGGRSAVIRIFMGSLCGVDFPFPRSETDRVNIPDDFSKSAAFFRLSSNVLEGCGPRERPGMMSASEGGGGSWNSGSSKGGCLNFILHICSKCGQGGRGSKIQKFCRHHIWKLPNSKFSPRQD